MKPYDGTFRQGENGIYYIGGGLFFYCSNGKPYYAEPDQPPSKQKFNTEITNDMVDYKNAMSIIKEKNL